MYRLLCLVLTLAPLACAQVNTATIVGTVSEFRPGHQRVGPPGDSVCAEAGVLVEGAD
jgi:hypothetical protein